MGTVNTPQSKEKLDPGKNQFIENDHRGNYDLDGVSYAGGDVIVSGDKSHENAEIYKSDKLRKKEKKPEDFDRQKNLDHETYKESWDDNRRSK